MASTVLTPGPGPGLNSKIVKFVLAAALYLATFAYWNGRLFQQVQALQDNMHELQEQVREVRTILLQSDTRARQ